MRQGIARTGIVVLVIAGLVLASALFSAAALADKKPGPHQLTILFTGDDQGNIKPPCG